MKKYLLALLFFWFSHCALGANLTGKIEKIEIAQGSVATFGFSIKDKSFNCSGGDAELAYLDKKDINYDAILSVLLMARAVGDYIDVSYAQYGGSDVRCKVQKVIVGEDF